jgi:hypothetical protein
VTEKARPVFVLKLRPEPHVTDSIKALRFALKSLLRRFGLRCVSIREEQPPESNSRNSANPPPDGFGQIHDP